MASWSDDIFDASFAGFPLVLEGTSDNEGRRIAKHRYPNRSGVRARDVGGEGRETQCTVLFFKNKTTSDPIAEFVNFRDLKNRGVVGRFIHPITGAYDALIEGFSWSVGASPVNWIAVDVTFVEAFPSDSEDLVIDVADLRGGSDVQSGVEATRNAEATLGAALADVGMQSNLGAAVLAESWLQRLTVPSLTDPNVTATTSAAITAREITLELNQKSSEISDEIVSLGIMSDVRNQPALAAYFEVSAALRATADAAISSTDRITEYTLTEFRSLLSLAAELYGPTNAAARAGEILALNTIANPALIPVGSVLVIRLPE